MGRDDERRDVGRWFEAQVGERVAIELAPCPDRRGTRERHRDKKGCREEQAPTTGDRVRVGHGPEERGQCPLLQGGLGRFEDPFAQTGPGAIRQMRTERLGDLVVRQGVGRSCLGLHRLLESAARRVQTPFGGSDRYPE